LAISILPDVALRPQSKPTTVVYALSTYRFATRLSACFDGHCSMGVALCCISDRSLTLPDLHLLHLRIAILLGIIHQSCPRGAYVIAALVTGFEVNVKRIRTWH